MRNKYHNRMLSLIPLLGIAFLLLCFSTGTAKAQIQLPQYGVCAQYFEKFNSENGDSFFDVTLNDDEVTGLYIGWCGDPYSGPPPYEGTADCNTDLYSSLDPNLPSKYTNYYGNPIHWDLINYLLNNKGNADNSDIQPAIWYFITGQRKAWDRAGWDCPVGSKCDGLVQDAEANGVGFMPGPDQILAVILAGNGIYGKGSGGSTTFNDKWQDIIIEFPGGGIGRFTGGGHQITVIDDSDNRVKVTRGFTIHCDLLLSNNLEINWQGNQFHMEEHIKTVACTDSPEIIQFPPAAPVDTIIGVGKGRFNGVDGYTIEFTLIDAGEPGTEDEAAFLIYETEHPTNVVLDVQLQTITGGNIQAHYDQPHK